ncbi:serine/threonine protein kinase [Gimesia algae]|uniref:non-specific serine/threonine protein kinase n=1 Tax=Gimesia algae TaxID=2527971 RepID=A0A517V8B0_9PLAN|nr:serine/threonine-protein kinase [Gimesia algae]QDT89238.1 Serine/threonine-protein kinase PrkC [Gimesia algae]
MNLSIQTFLGQAMAKRNENTPEKKKRQSARVPKLETLGKYKIEKEIGAGGMGAVFLARDTRLNRLAALKILPRDKAENPVLVKRFKAEGQAAAHLRHENIVSVYDAGEEDGYLYIALEYVEGTDLHNLINKRKRIPIRRSLEIITQVTEALSHAYQQGIVHRDIKPANILIRLDGVVKLTDLGLARSIDDNTETSITRAGTTVGTVDYMAPEQARDSKAADIRSDIYSLGCTWYHMLTGRAPFSEGSLTNKLAAHATTPPPDPRELNDRVPEGIVAIIHRMMAKPQADRYQTPAELLEDLKNSNLKRSNVGNDVLEALANDESDGEQPALGTDDLPAADSSDFLINQFMPDYSSPTDDQEDEESETHDRLSTSFDLQQLAGEVEFESDVTVPGLKRPAKSAKPAKGKKQVERRRSSGKRQEPQEEEEGSVISDSAMKTRQTASSSKQDSPAASPPRKGTRPASREKQTPEKTGARKSQGYSGRPPKKSLKTTNVTAVDEPVAGGQIAVDYRQIAMLAGGVLILILLIWWAINALDSSADGPQQGPASNPFATAEQNQQGNLANAEDQPGNAATGEQPVEDSTQEEVAVTDAKTAVDSSNQKGGAAESWKGMPVRGQEKKYLPDWGAVFSALSGPNAGNLDPRLPVLKVVQGKNESGVWGSLNQALSEVTSRGAVIRLYGTGPFLFNPHRLQDVSQLIIMADADQKPTILMQTKSENETQAEVNQFSFSSGLLRFQGVDLLCDVSGLTGSGVCNILDLKQSDLTFQDSSFTLTGTTDRTIRLINSTGAPRTTTGRPEGESRIFLENSVIMGRKLEAVRVDQIYADVLISNCFLSSKGAPCLELDSLELALTPGLILQERKVPRTTRIFSSTLLSDQTIFALTGPQEKKKGEKSEQAALASSQTDIVVINSVLIGSQKNKQATMLNLENWPQDKLRSQSASRFDEIKVQLENTLLWGWPSYLRSTEQGNAQNLFRIDSHRTWQQSWGNHVAADMFQPNLPAELDDLLTPAFIKPLLDFSKQKNVYAISADGVTAGCDPARLTTLTASQQRRIKAVLGKPDIEQAIQTQFAKAKAVTFDMTKGNLSDFLNSPAISGPTRVNLSGQGNCYMSPVTLENKQIQLVFEHKSAESPQVVELKLIPSTAKSRSKSGIEAFFGLKNSTLVVSGGAFRISPDRKGVVPRHFVSCQNSRLGLDQCALSALLLNNNRFQSAIYVEPDSKGKSNQIQIDHSFLTASSTIIQSGSNQLDLEVNNSLFLSQQDIFALPAKAGDSPGIHVGLNQSTFAPRGSVFAIKQESGSSNSGRSAIQIIAEESLFLPAPSSSASRSDFSNTASLISTPQSSSGHEGIEWWGTSNGYMVERFNATDRATGGSPGAGKEFSADMKSLFGADADQHELSMRGGVILQDQKLPPLVKLQPVHFQLLPTCKAATWSALKQPLGADPAVLQKIIEGKQSQDKSGRLKRAF